MEEATEMLEGPVQGRDSQSLIEYSIVISVVVIGSLTAVWLMKEQIAALVSVVSAALRTTL